MPRAPAATWERCHAGLDALQQGFVGQAIIRLFSFTLKICSAELWRFLLSLGWLGVDHRIIEWPGLKRITMIIQSQPPAMCRVANHQTRLPRATSSLALNACRDGASTASLGNLFSASPPWVKNFFLISNLDFPCLSLKPFPLILSLLAIHVLGLLEVLGPCIWNKSYGIGKDPGEKN